MSTHVGREFTNVEWTVTNIRWTLMHVGRKPMDVKQTSITTDVRRKPIDVGWTSTITNVRWKSTNVEQTSTATDVKQTSNVMADDATTSDCNNTMATTLDTSSATMACKKIKWVYNHWKTNLWFLLVLATMEQLSCLLVTKYKRKRWLNLAWQWWWCRRVPKQR
jgi:hypothetical protein